MLVFIKKIISGVCLVAVALCLASCHKTGTKDTPAPVAGQLPDPGPNWTRLTVLNDTITVLEEFNHTLYAASNSNTLYTSVNGGATWASVKVGAPDVSISAIRVFNGQIYLGTNNNGIFSSNDGGRTWSNYVSGFRDYNTYGFLVGYPVTSFAVKDNLLYAATEGNGVYALNQATGNWSAFNNNLPQNFTSYNVFKLLSSNNTLVAAGGVNGTFYYYDFANSRWTETLLPHWGSYIQKMIIDNGVLYAVTSEGKIIRSSNNGLSWDYDTADLYTVQALNYKDLYSGTTKNYTFTVVFSFIDSENGTTIQQRDKNIAIGSSWANGQQFLEGVHAHAILESGGILFLGTDQGLYAKHI
ncbi:hypothetical protein BEL04_09580 [Mucilaginibacter sp. PPCGB 2223]|uniref:PQQ-binding-like beta-propeller repeat protein n=1 Tax=Mucilaginibacter sp. PPCGB 2223 TaxID=1886027 RepID=UPI000825D86B|nr:PQQ-binding-like beta-propeller repeat protein [Mucilaginibacter sp. PPCGB 2223]OCX54479.1 hypothetical protein BEL04_09580 [Mucilaginibacter sp. PPCGB 2223]